MKAPTPETIVLTGGLVLGAYLTSSVPVLASAGAPVIAGLVLIIYARGLDRFCRWTQTLAVGVNATSENY